MPKRQYNDQYIKFGFIELKNSGQSMPQCVMCMKALSNAAMRPSLLQRHLHTNHPDKKDRDPSYFERLGENVKKQRLDKTGKQYQQSAGIVTASYEIALLVAKNKKCHTIAEDLIMPAAKALVKHVIGEEAVSKLNSVSVSNNTIQRRIKEMSTDINEQVITEVQGSKYGFAIQLDESTDVSNCAQLLVYVRYVSNDAIQCELLLSKDMTTTTTGKDVFELVDSFFKENNLQWTRLVGCTTDGAPAMLGRKSGFQARVKAVSPSVTSVHCFIHRFALAAKVLPSGLKASLNLIVKMVNHIKTSALNSRLFRIICEDIGSQYTTLLFHTEVRWLSRGNTTKRLFELREELLQFFKTREHELQKNLEDENFILHLAYLSDIFEAMNSFNYSLQGSDSNIIDFSMKLTAFTRKLDVWMNNIENRQFGMFENVVTLGSEPSVRFGYEVSEHLLLLKAEIKRYFPNDGNAQTCTYIRNPFNVDPGNLPVGTGEQEELIDLQADEGARDKFEKDKLANFWLNVGASYPTLCKNAVSQLLIFPSTWECEQGFSTFLMIKSKSRNRLTKPEHDFRCAVSCVAPRIGQLVEQKQQHPSH